MTTSPLTVPSPLTVNARPGDERILDALLRSGLTGDYASTGDAVEALVRRLHAAESATPNPDDVLVAIVRGLGQEVAMPVWEIARAALAIRRELQEL